MSFQTRLFITYSLLIVFLIAIFGVFFYHYILNVFEQNAYSNLEVITDKMSEQLDNLIKPMDLMTTFLLSTDEFMTSMTILSTLDKTIPQNRTYISKARDTIQSNVITYAAHKHFYRVSYFNKIGDFATTNFIQQEREDIREVISQFDWIHLADKARGSIIIIPPYDDPWPASGSAKVFGLARCVHGSRESVGYLEVQNLYSEIEEIFSVPSKNNIKVYAITSSDMIFYKNSELDNPLMKYYLQCATTNKASVSEIDNSINSRKEIVAGIVSDYTGIRLILVQDKQTLLRPILYTLNITILVAFLIMLASFGYIFIFSKQLAKPIRQLKEKMEGIEYENLPEKISINSTNNEIEALNQSFQRLRIRINDAISREIKARTLQMQANFDSLHAEVNPHFLYNILNVLSHKGIINGDEEICEICDGIASMLRYSTSKQKSSSTIQEELEHVRNYLNLMKKRFEHKLEYFFDIDPLIYEEPVPKIILQQIVENSLNHGYKNSKGKMRISIRGHISNRFWYMEITDNGDGFEPKILEEIELKMKDMEKKIMGIAPITGLSIGGMGLVNTYARMALFYKNKIIFKLSNVNDGGARVLLGSQLSKMRSE